MYATMSSVIIVWINRECMHEIKFLVRALRAFQPHGPSVSVVCGKACTALLTTPDNAV